MWNPLRKEAVVAQKYKEQKEKGFTNVPLSLEESIEVIIKLTTNYLCTIIVIDALDECNDRRHKLLDALDSIVQKGSGFVKILVSSRDDKDIVLHLQELPNLYIKASDNAGDIYRFVQTEVKQAITKKKLLAGNVSPELKQEIIKVLTTQAQGM
jgi:excinuclease UvrABC ATPase subunit